jgi:hypothetical protein
MRVNAVSGNQSREVRMRAGVRGGFWAAFALSDGTMRHSRWRAISCPPALARCCPVSVPSARGFFLPHHRVSRFRWLPLTAAAPTRNCRA